MGRRLGNGQFDSRATAAGVQTAAGPDVGASDQAFDFDAEPYGPVEPDEVSWFVPLSRGRHAATRDEREARALVEQLLGG